MALAPLGSRDSPTQMPLLLPQPLCEHCNWATVDCISSRFIEADRPSLKNSTMKLPSFFTALVIFVLVGVFQPAVGISD